MNARKKPLEKWIQEALTDPDKEYEGKPITCSGFDLKHQIGQSERHVHAVKLGKEVTAKHLADLFKDKAETHAQDLPGVQYFRINAYYGEVSEPQASLTFVVTGATDWGNATEGPDEKGKTQQGMRLTEMLVQGAFAMNKFTFEAMGRGFEAQSTALARTMQQNAELTSVVQQLLLSQATKNHEYELELGRQKMIGRMVDFAPALVNTATGTNVFPESTEDTALVSAVLNSIPEPMLRHLFTQLPPAVAGPLAARLERELEKKDKEKKDRARVTELTLKSTNGSTDDEGFDNEKAH